MAPTLYQIAGSPPVRAVLMTAKSIGLDLNLKDVNLFTDEHKTPEFLKMNPQHTVPTLQEDDGFVVWESHAIMPYLISVYGKDDSLYPKDPKTRALIDQRLHFDSGVVFPRLLRIFQPILFRDQTSIKEEDKEAVLCHYQWLECFLEGRKWIAGDSVTIADFSLISTISSLNVIIPVDEEKYARLKTWLNNAEELPEYEANVEGLKIVGDLLKSKLGL